MTQADLTALMKQVAEGDRNAFRLLAQHLGQQIFAMAFRLLNGNKASAEDVVQDVLIKLWQNAPRWKPTGSVAAYASRLTYTTCMDRHRANKNLTALPEEIPEAETVTDKVVQFEQRKKLMDGIHKLPKRQQEAILLAYFHENRHKDVATIMGTTEKAVEHLVSRGLKTLATTLPADLKEGGYLK